MFGFSLRHLDHLDYLRPARTGPRDRSELLRIALWPIRVYRTVDRLLCLVGLCLQKGMPLNLFAIVPRLRRKAAGTR